MLIFILASQLLNKVVDISEGLPGAEGHLARAFFKLSIVAADMQKDDESLNFKKKALEIRTRVCGTSIDAPFEESEFAKLNLFMLW
jgi:hypothetical protein